MRFLITGDYRTALLLCSLFSQSTAYSPFDSQHECRWNSTASTSLLGQVSYRRLSLLTVMLSIPFQALQELEVSMEVLHPGNMVGCRHSQRRSDLVSWVALSWLPRSLTYCLSSQCSRGLVYKWLKNDEIQRHFLLGAILEGFHTEDEGVPGNCSIVPPPCFVELQSTQGIAGGSVLVRCSVVDRPACGWHFVYLKDPHHFLNIVGHSELLVETTAESLLNKWTKHFSCHRLCPSMRTNIKVLMS